MLLPLLQCFRLVLPQLLLRQNRSRCAKDNSAGRLQRRLLLLLLYVAASDARFARALLISRIYTG